MDYNEAKRIWDTLNEITINDDRFRGYRPILYYDRAEGCYIVRIREIYKF